MSMSVKQAIVATKQRMEERGREGWTQTGGYFDGDKACLVGHMSRLLGVIPEAVICGSPLGAHLYRTMIGVLRLDDRGSLVDFNDERTFEEVLDFLREAAIVAPDDVPAI